ncbi:hypothetical protein E4T56_gene10092 [Termitomyces sp. T112]|nr:hypothetical protein E4T56_gene10092 [Termitomyces sp. T112]
MKVDNNGPKSITALMQLLAPPRQSYPPLPTIYPAATSTNKRKGKATATLPFTPAQESSTPSLTTWKTVKQCFSAKEKGKGKAKEPEPSNAADKQITHLLQWLHEAGVSEDDGADILDNPVAQMDLFHSTLEKEKHVASPPQLPEAKKAHTEPSVFVKGSLTQRAPPVPYDDDVPAGDDQRMDECPDLKVLLPIAGPSSPAAAKARPPKLAVAKAGPSRSTTLKAGTAKPAVTPVVADNPVIVATLIVFPANMPWVSEAGMIEVLKPRTYIISSILFQEPVPITHWDLCDKEFFVTQVQAAQAAMGAPVTFDLGSNDDDDVSTSKQCILDSDSDNNINEHCCKKQHNVNAK